MRAFASFVVWISWCWGRPAEEHGRTQIDKDGHAEIGNLSSLSVRVGPCSPPPPHRPPRLLPQRAEQASPDEQHGRGAPEGAGDGVEGAQGDPRPVGDGVDRLPGLRQELALERLQALEVVEAPCVAAHPGEQRADGPRRRRTLRQARERGESPRVTYIAPSSA